MIFKGGMELQKLLLKNLNKFKQLINLYASVTSTNNNYSS